jgi:hypothetical protein
MADEREAHVRGVELLLRRFRYHDAADWKLRFGIGHFKQKDLGHGGQ